MEIAIQDKPKEYALSCFGWGACGIIAAQAARLRNTVPQAKLYDVAGGLTVMRNWCCWWMRATCSPLPETSEVSVRCGVSREQ